MGDAISSKYVGVLLTSDSDRPLDDARWASSALGIEYVRTAVLSNKAPASDDSI